MDWKASKQRTVTSGLTEADLLALSTTTSQYIWGCRPFEEINLMLHFKLSI